MLTQKPEIRGLTELIYVWLPAAIEPDEREERFAQAIDDELRLETLGYVSGGGSLIVEDDLDDQGDGRIEGCGVDVEAVDVAAVRALLHRLLPSLECPIWTELHYRQNGRRLLDAFDGIRWDLGQPRDMTHPAFGL